jgi:hypothetical protein
MTAFAQDWKVGIIGMAKPCTMNVNSAWRNLIRDRLGERLSDVAVEEDIDLCGHVV